MAQVQKNNLFPSLNQLLAAQDRNWEDELPSEQYFSIVLAYNDKLTDKKRENKTNALHKKVYSLSQDEKAGLELAYKSGRSGNFGEDSVLKSFVDICCPEVAKVIAGKGSRHEKLEKLHKLTVEKLAQNENITNHKNYIRLENKREKLEEQEEDSFKKECETLDFFGERSSSIFSQLSRLGKEKRDALVNQINNEVDSALERVFAYVLNSVEYVSGIDALQKAFQKAQILQAEEAVVAV